MSKAKIWEGSVYLEPVRHQYHHRVTGKIYRSVTTTLHSFVPEFDSDSVSLAIANQLDTVKNEKYIGMSQQEILDNWVEINRIANEYGTRIHEIMERYLLGNGFYFPPENEDGEFEWRVIDAYNELKIDVGINIYPERVLFSEEHELAGCADIIVDIDENFYDIIDFKTNKEYNFINKFNHQTLLPPFDFLQNSQHSVYTLQLSIYSRLYQLEFPHKKCRQMIVLYWDKETYKFTKIPITYMKSEAQKLIEIHHYNVMKNS